MSPGASKPTHLHRGALALGAVLTAIPGCGIEAMTIITAGVGQGSYAPLIIALGPLALIDSWLPIPLLWIAPPILWAGYGVVIAAAIQQPKFWLVATSLVALHVLSVCYILTK